MTKTKRVLYDAVPFGSTTSAVFPTWDAAAAWLKIQEGGIIVTINEKKERVY